MYDEAPVQTPYPSHQGGGATRWLVAAVAGLGVIALIVGVTMTMRAGQTTSVDAAASLAASKTGQAGQATTTAVATNPINLADGSTTTVPDVAITTVAGPQGAAATPAPAPKATTPAPPPAPVTTTPAPPSAPAPVITSFHTPENIDCHNGNFQTFSVDWSTTNATKVTISIDGPGVYKTYPATGSDSLPFNCSSPHTFLLTAYGHDGKTVTKSITLQPRNVQVPASNDDTE